MPGFSLSFNPGFLSQIAQMAAFETLLSTEVQSAMSQAGSLLIASIRGNMHWEHPTGALENSIQVVNDSPYEIEVGSSLPYARRREFGFTDMVDSLGRYFPYDPGAYFMLHAYEDTSDEVYTLIESAVSSVLNEIAA
jgi:hypothetical protein